MSNTIQRELSGSDARVVTESQLVKKGEGVLRGIFITATSSGTLKIHDAVEGGSAASVTLTSTGACAPAAYATGTLTISGAISDGETVTIGTTVYRFKSTMAQAYDVKIGANDAATLDNLKLAVNATGVAGTNYFSGTVAHPTVIATTNTDTTQLFVARTIGTGGNAIASTETMANGAFGGATLSGGVATSAATITIGDITYTAVTSLPETHGLTAIPYYVLWVTSEAVFLDNLKAAVNGTGTSGTTYSAGTEAHPLVIATANTNTTQVFTAKKTGTQGNSIASTETLANYAFSSATLSGGTGTEGTLIMDTFTPSANTKIELNNVEFNNGLYITVGGTSISASVFYK